MNTSFRLKCDQSGIRGGKNKDPRDIPVTIIYCVCVMRSSFGFVANVVVMKLLDV